MTYTIEMMARDSKRSIANYKRRKREAVHRAFVRMHRMKSQMLIQILLAVGLTGLTAYSAFT
jgi:hypothetical protein